MKQIFDRLLSNTEGRKGFQREEVILDATELVCALMEIKGVDRAELASRMGIKKSYLTKMLSGSDKLTIAAFSDMCFALDAKPTFSHKDNK